jgi:hypothetical protein
MKSLSRALVRRAVLLATVAWSALAAGNDCILSCNDARHAALSACQDLAAAEQASCLQAALAQYDSCTLSCLASLAPPFIRGDANRDGAVDAADAVFLLGELFADGGPSTCPDASDANDDGKMDIADPIAVLGYLFRAADSIPPPTTAPGQDPTPNDEFGCFGGSEGRPPLDLLLPRDTRIATFSLG